MLVIAGAFYFNEEENKVLVPSYTGEYEIVDCEEYLTEEKIIEDYDKPIADRLLANNPVTVRGEQYYSINYQRPHYVTESWELLPFSLQLPLHTETVAETASAQSSPPSGTSGGGCGGSSGTQRRRRCWMLPG